MSARARATAGERAYRLLLRLYPAEFRRRYGRAMADFHRDRLRGARAAGEPTALVWARVVADLLLSAAAERVRAARAPSRLLPPEPREPLMRTLLQDLGYAARGLARGPAFTAVVLATIALGVGANGAIFSVVSGILLRPLPYPHPERVVAFGHEPPHWLASDNDFQDYRRELRAFERLAAYTRNEATLSGDGAGDPERVRIVRATEDFFPALGVAPLAGRTFAPDEYRGNPPTVVVISHALWQRRMGGDRGAVGKTLTINGVPRTVVGVMPPRFDFPEARTDVWSPMPPLTPDTLGGRTNHYLFMVGRLRPGVTVERALAEATTLARRIMRDEPQYFDPKAPLIPHIERVHDQLVGPTRPYLVALLGAVGFVLLIVCANVANLLLVRGEGRRKELAVRRALGASGRRLVTQLLTESAALAAVGGALGLALAWGANRALLRLAPSSIPRLEEVGIDWRVLAFTLGATVLTGLLIGAMPAWRVARGDPTDAVKGGGRTTGAHGAAAGARRALVVAEVALAVVMLSGAGMLVRSLLHLQQAGLGFAPEGVLTAKVSVSQREYDDARTALYYEQLIARLRAIPGVRAAAAAGWLPVVDNSGLWGFRPEGGEYPNGRWPSAAPQQITPGWLAAVGLPLLEGRDFTADDREGRPYVALVSRSFAEASWPRQRAVGKRFRLGGPESPFVTVVGVVGDLRAHGFGDEVVPTMYFPHAQAARSAYFVPRAMGLLVRVACAPRARGCDPLAYAGAVRAAVRALDATVPVSEVRTLEQVVATSVASRRFSTALLLAFAALALALAGIGTYGVISYGVSQRTYEIGVRMALGAERGRVRRLVLGEGLRMCTLGLALGIAGSLGVARAIRAMLVGVSTVDLPTLAAVCPVLLAVAAVASALPARRAMGVSPTEALRGS